MRIEEDLKLDFKDVLIRPKRSEAKSRKDVTLDRVYTFRNGKTWTGIPVIAANMDGVGTFSMARALSSHGMLTCLAKSYTPEDWVNNRSDWSPFTTMISTGISSNDLIKTQKILDNWEDLDFVCIDVANGYSEYFVDCVRRFREKNPTKTIIAGNVVTADMTQELLLAGADIVKVGIGPGSVCTTRIKTGVGYPQLSAIIECADAAHGMGGHIIADGGCTCPGDVAKAFAAGADFVMMGGMFAGHKEGGGEIIEKKFKSHQYEVDIDGTLINPIIEKKKFIQFYGMSSDTAMYRHQGTVADYKASEGRTVQIPFKGDVDDTVKDLLGGLRSTCTYVGAHSLKQLSKCTTFVRVTQQFNGVFTK
jgi:GMP reductase|tara:strand:- start:1838 stop:2926 length:1089 start_codon:yes stop_codon:yes gene_type:complete